jgi:DNA-binding response OmpR family regulator
VRILVVEDEHQLAANLREGLQADGYEVDVAGDGVTGLALARRYPYRAMILDLMLPRLNGYRVCAELRRAGSTVPILMLTAKDGEYDEAEALDTGADDYLTKPFSYLVLLARLRALVLARLDHSQPVPSTVDDVPVVDLAGIVAEHMAERTVTSRTGIDFIARAAQPVPVAGAELSLRRVPGNLVDNAARYAATTVVASVTAQDGVATLAVADDGPGIPPADRDRIFERFVRLDDARGRDSGGAGLGLAIVHGIVTSLGGSVRVAEGATFVVTLPLAGADRG